MPKIPAIQKAIEEIICGFYRLETRDDPNVPDDLQEARELANEIVGGLKKRGILKQPKKEAAAVDAESFKIGPREILLERPLSQEQIDALIKQIDAATQVPQPIVQSPSGLVNAHISSSTDTTMPMRLELEFVPGTSRAEILRDVDKFLRRVSGEDFTSLGRGWGKK